MPDAPPPPPGWDDLPFFRETWPALWARLAASPPWQPGPEAIFRALTLTSPDRVRAVILGQDPYHTPGRATGLAFAFPPGDPPRDSLRNILTELRIDLGIARPHGDLSGWAAQGVLLLNTVLTVPLGEANGHRNWGWETLTTQILARVAQSPTAFLLWGAPAQRIAKPHLGPQHLSIESPHPSPLSAHRGFLGSRPFSRTNDWLIAQGRPAIDWSA